MFKLPSYHREQNAVFCLESWKIDINFLSPKIFKFAHVYVVHCHVTWTRWRNLNTLLKLEVSKLFALHACRPQHTSIWPPSGSVTTLRSRYTEKYGVPYLSDLAWTGLEHSYPAGPWHEKGLRGAWDATGAAFLRETSGNPDGVGTRLRWRHILLACEQAPEGASAGCLLSACSSRSLFAGYHLARSGSQSRCRIRFILPAQGASLPP